MKDDRKLTKIRSYVESKLDELEAELHFLGLWETEPLPESMLCSSAPFGCDVMALHQWLQHIFLPRFRALLQSGGMVPGKMNITSIAEFDYRDDPDRYRRLLEILRELDRAVEAGSKVHQSNGS